MRIMGIDYGDARTGLAVSDAMNILVGVAWTVNQWDADALADEIVREARSRSVERFVLGLPRNMDGTEGEHAEKSRELAMMLSNDYGISTELWDERLTTVLAYRLLDESQTFGKKRKSAVDTVSATVILEDYLKNKNMA